MGEKQTKSSKARAGKKILIIEDEQPLSHALHLKFTNDGNEVSIAKNGEEGLQMATSNKFDVILLDLIMPKMDGFTFLERLNEKKVKTPVVILSNLGQEEDRKRAEEMGVSGYYVKSNTPITEILKTVSSLLK
ncbi:response regulator [Candidatus Peregrinibacteria bacterium]|jgi:two-component system, OmpR family, alkaline phosphatase synthesis response regulator PhoP|nr:response regulator [Candidatus Peregrinibacteria bacterium]MBT3598238.1 response regulator [Candidatus Peregrinibacteria bacterium]MBT4585359.1 response regulator [Candidatus Peregrinibacteria bacterium]MBT6730987.1 response regulator [Candidatus Peregrinibacteria bacterium]MBT7009618.1 response regulator [Candidatus Peregrinibacteria bacterium]